MKKSNLIKGGVFAFMAFVASNNKQKTKSTKIIYADVAELAPDDRTPSGNSGTGTPV